MRKMRKQKDLLGLSRYFSDGSMIHNVFMYHSTLSLPSSCMSGTSIVINRGLVLFTIFTMLFPLSVSSMSMLRVTSWVSHFFAQQAAKFVLRS